MSDARLRRTIAAVAAVVAVLGTSACSMRTTGFDAQTNFQYQAGIGADQRDTDVQVLGALLVVNDDGTATLSATLLNTTDDVQQLTGVSVIGPDGNAIEVETAGDLLDVPVRRAVQLGVEDSLVAFLAAPVETGRYHTVTLSFSDAEDVEIAIPSVVRTAIYDPVVAPPGSTAPADDAAAEAEAEEGH